MKSVIRLTILSFICIVFQSPAQIILDVELRPRFEYRHGYKTLFPDMSDPATFVSQRTRLNTGYFSEKLNFYVSIQDVRVWGDVPQLNTSDKNGLSVHQAWGEILFKPEWILKVGRQEIIYDDSRFFGNVNWAQQARSHDAALLKFRKNNLKVELGFAYNQDGESLTGNDLTVNTYKYLQYVWVHKEWENYTISLVFLNNGLQYIDQENEALNKTRYSQTIGSHHIYKKGKLSLSGNLYYQFGSDRTNNTLSAYLFGIDGNYQISDNFIATLGAEILSGNDNGSPSNGTNNAFNPFYGTNHKFNGYMDYFYVGNHYDNVGLIDVYAKVKMLINSKNSVNLALHNFMSAADIPNTDSNQLGTELDIVYVYSFNKDISFKGGYSQMFASEGMEIIKNNFDGNTNNWGWVMITISPTIFNSKATKTKL